MASNKQGGWATMDKKGKKAGGKGPGKVAQGDAPPKPDDANKKLLLQKQEEEWRKRKQKEARGQRTTPPPVTPLDTPAVVSPKGSSKGGSPAVSPSLSASGAIPFSFTLNLKPSGYLLKGISNRGNTCYQNAVLQALLSAPAFLNLVKSLPPATVAPSERFPLICAVRQFVFSFKSSDAGSAAPADAIEVLRVMQKYSKSFPMGSQHDACEFLIAFLNSLETELSAMTGDTRPKKSSVEDGWQTASRGGKSRGVEHSTGFSEKGIIQAIFGGHTSSRLAARGAAPSVTLQAFTVLPLDVISDKVTSVEGFLQDYTSPQTVEVAGAPASKQDAFSSLPSTLCLCLNLWFDAAAKATVARRIRINEALTIHASSTTSRKRQDYVLHAVVGHKGVSMTSGHYTAAIKKQDRWNLADDASMSSLPNLTSFNADPYLLFYTRKS